MPHGMTHGTLKEENVSLSAMSLKLISFIIYSFYPGSPVVEKYNNSNNTNTNSNNYYSCN